MIFPVACLPPPQEFNTEFLARSKPVDGHPLKSKTQYAVAEMAPALGPIGPHIEKLAEDWSASLDHGATADQNRLGQVSCG